MSYDFTEMLNIEFCSPRRMENGLNFTFTGSAGGLRISVAGLAVHKAWGDPPWTPRLGRLQPVQPFLLGSIEQEVNKAPGLKKKKKRKKKLKGKKWFICDAQSNQLACWRTRFYFGILHAILVNLITLLKLHFTYMLFLVWCRCKFCLEIRLQKVDITWFNYKTMIRAKYRD